MAIEYTTDTLLDGKVILHQPRSGYRAAIDPILLAASVPAETGQSVLDLGCGVGTVGLCLMRRVSGLTVTGIDIQKDLIELARQNADANPWADQAEFIHEDLADMDTHWRAESFDHVVFNPPYLSSERADPSPNPIKATADTQNGLGLDAWTRRALRCLKRKGRLSLVHRADCLETVIASLMIKLDGAGFGEITVTPLWPKQRVDAKRVLVSARKGVRGPARLTAGLVLHDGDGEFTPKTQRILDGEPLEV